MKEKTLLVLGLLSIFTIFSSGPICLAETFIFNSSKYYKFNDYTVFIYKVDGSKIEGVLVIDNAEPAKNIIAEKGEYTVDPESNKVKLNLINGVDKIIFKNMPFQTLSFDIKLPAIEMDKGVSESQWGIKLYPQSSFNMLFSIVYQAYLYDQIGIRAIVKAYETPDDFNGLVSFYDRIYPGGHNFWMDNAPEKKHRIYHIDQGGILYALLLWNEKETSKESSVNTIIIYRTLEEINK